MFIYTYDSMHYHTVNILILSVDILLWDAIKVLKFVLYTETLLWHNDVLCADKLWHDWGVAIFLDFLWPFYSLLETASQLCLGDIYKN